MSQTGIIPGEATERGQANAWSLPDVSEPGSAARQRRVPAQTATSVEALERIQRDAYAEAFAQGQKEGHKKGFREGRSEGLQQGQAEAAELVRRMRGLLESMAEPAAELDDAVEEELLALILSLAQQIIRRELHTQPGEIVGVIREAVALLPLSAREVKVQVHPDDAAFIRETLGEGETAWQLVDDPGITRGGCVINSTRSRVDATLEHRLAALAADLLGDGRRQVPEGGSHETRR